MVRNTSAITGMRVLNEGGCSGKIIRVGAGSGLSELRTGKVPGDDFADEPPEYVCQKTIMNGNPLVVQPGRTALTIAKWPRTWMACVVQDTKYPSVISAGIWARRISQKDAAIT